MRRSAGYLLAVCTALCASRATAAAAAAAAGGPASFYLTRQQPFRSVETVASRPSAARGDGPTPQLKQGFDWCAARYPLSENYFPPKENAELILVQVVTRHGDRTPLSSHTYQDVTWDCDGDNQFSFLTSNLTGIRPDRALVSRELVAIPIAGPYSFGTWSGSCDVGQLTPRGAAYQREIGEELRKIYIDRLQFLPKTFNESAGLYVRSAALGRTKQSASRLISGLYPNAFRPDDSVINLVTVPTNIEYMTRNYAHCPRQAKLVKKMTRSKEFRKHLQRNKSLWKKLRSIFGEPHNPAWPARSFLAYLDYLVPRRCHLLPLPCNRRLTSCLTEKDVDAILDNAHWEFEHLFRDGDHAEEFTRATTGPFLAELRDSVFRHAKAASERGSAKHPRYNDGSEDLSNSAFELYSTHEETIAALLGAFKAKYVHVPPYSSNIVVELWRDPAGAGVPGGYDDFFIRIFYNGKIVEVPWCDLNACPVEWVWQYTKPLIPDDVQTECGTKYFKGDSDDGDLDDLDDATDPDVGADPAAVFAA